MPGARNSWLVPGLGAWCQEQLVPGLPFQHMLLLDGIGPGLLNWPLCGLRPVLSRLQCDWGHIKSVSEKLQKLYSRQYVKLNLHKIIQLVNMLG